MTAMTMAPQARSHSKTVQEVVVCVQVAPEYDLSYFYETGYRNSRERAADMTMPKRIAIGAPL